MSRKPRVQRTPEEKWQIVLEGLKSGNVAETCRKYEIAPNLYYRWKDEVEAGAKAALGEKRRGVPMPSRRSGSSYWRVGWSDSRLQVEILRNVLAKRAAGQPIRGFVDHSQFNSFSLVIIRRSLRLR